MAKITSPATSMIIPSMQAVRFTRSIVVQFLRSWPNLSFLATRQAPLRGQWGESGGCWNWLKGDNLAKRDRRVTPGTSSQAATFLDTRSFTRVGGEKSITVNARLIAATNKDLRREVSAGRFRKDLFYRLNVFEVKVPPLRDRRDDIPILMQEIIADLASRTPRHQHGPVDATAMDRLINYAWPGNVRELRNVLERALILSKGRPIRAHHLALQPDNDVRVFSANFPLTESLDVVLGKVERSLIEEALQLSRNNQRAAACLLGISRFALARHMKKFGITVPQEQQTL